MNSEPETAFERYAEILFTSANISHLKQKFPRANYESTSEWAEAVKAELESLSPGTGRPGELNVLAEITRSSTTKSQAAVADELNLRERLDAMIARQAKQSRTDKGHEANASPSVYRVSGRTTKKNRREEFSTIESSACRGRKTEFRFAAGGSDVSPPAADCVCHREAMNAR